MSKFRFVLTGKSPLLMHADNVEASDAVTAWLKVPENRKSSPAGDDRWPPWKWLTSVYVDPESGNFAIPSDNIMVALRHAGAQIVMSKQKTFKSATQSGLLIYDEYCKLVGPKGEIAHAEFLANKDAPFADQAKAAQARGFSLFVKRAAIGKSKNVRVRARFEEWECSGVIEVTDSAITDDVLRQLFDRAGTYAGLCDWRPSAPKCPGRFGMFEAKLTKL